MAKKEKKGGLEDRVTELEGDLRRVVALLGKTQGEPFSSAAKEIVDKHQGRG